MIVSCEAAQSAMGLTTLSAVEFVALLFLMNQRSDE